MKDSPYQRLLAFLTSLEDRKIAYSLSRARDEAVMVEVAVPRERWEVEFLSDGTIDVEKFVSTGTMWCGDETIDSLLAAHAE